MGPADHTPGAKQCGGKSKRTGNQCGALALKGTDPPRCRSHLGKSPKVFKDERDLKAQAAKVGARLVRDGIVKPIEDPLTRLLQLAEEADGWLAGLREEVGKLEEIRYRIGAGEQQRTEVRLYTEAMDRLGKFLVDVARLNIDERLTRIEEAKVAMIVTVLQRVLRANGVDPADGDVMRLVQTELLAVEAAQQPKSRT